MHAVFRALPEIRAVILFGSRAKGTYTSQSDVDVSLVGVIDDLRAEAVAAALDLLPMPYRFDVKAHDGIRYRPLLDHIQRVGVTFYDRERHGTPTNVDAEPVVVDALWSLRLVLSQTFPFRLSSG